MTWEVVVLNTLSQGMVVPCIILLCVCNQCEASLLRYPYRVQSFMDGSADTGGTTNCSKSL